MAQVETLQPTIVETLPAFLPLAEAALVTGLDVETLHNWISQGKVIAGTLPGGEIAVAVRDGKVVMLENGLANGQATGNGEHEHEGDVFELNRRLAAIKREQFKHLEGQEIGLSEAAREFRVPYQVLQRWIKRGYIRVLRIKGRQKFLDKGDVAFCVAIYKVRKNYGSRAPLLDEQGQPYLIKHPALAQARRIG